MANPFGAVYNKFGEKAGAFSTGGGGAPHFSYTNVFMFFGDSQPYGTTTAAEQAAAIASYPVSSKVKTLNASLQWVTYTPGTITGMHYGANSGQVGVELEVIKRFRADYPNDEVKIIKYVHSGSCEGLPVPLGTINASISGQLLTRNSGIALQNSALIKYTGSPSGLYVPFVNVADPSWYVRVTPSTSNPGLTVVSQTMTVYDGLLSWKADEGLAYWPNNNSLTRGGRYFAQTALAALTNHRLTMLMPWRGTNDKANTTTANAFGAALEANAAQYATDFDLTYAKVIMVRARDINPSSPVTDTQTVQAAQQSRADASAKWYLINSNPYGWASSGPESGHANYAGLTGIGGEGYDIWTGLSNGI